MLPEKTWIVNLYINSSFDSQVITAEQINHRERPEYVLRQNGLLDWIDWTSFSLVTAPTSVG